MSKEKIKAMDEALSNNGRRSFLKGLLLGGAAVAAMPLMKSQALAQDDKRQRPEEKEEEKGRRRQRTPTVKGADAGGPTSLGPLA